MEFQKSCVPQPVHVIVFEEEYNQLTRKISGLNDRISYIEGFIHQNYDKFWFRFISSKHNNMLVKYKNELASMNIERKKLVDDFQAKYDDKRFLFL